MTSRRSDHPEIDRFSLPSPLGAIALLYAGSQRCSPGHRWDGVRDHALLHIVIHGRGTVWSDNGRFPVGPSNYFLYLPHARARYRASTADPWTYLWVGFTCKNRAALASLAGVSDHRPIGQDPLQVETLDLASQIISALDHRSPTATVRANGLLLQILSQLCPRPYVGDDRLGPETYVGAAVEFIQNNYERAITVDAIAHHVGIDRAYLCRCFRRSMGTTPQEYLIRHRIGRARQLLATTTLPVSAVASSVGYENYASFERRYRAVIGEPPRSTRSSNKETASWPNAS